MPSPQVLTFEALVEEIKAQSMQCKRWWAFWMLIALLSLTGGIATLFVAGWQPAAIFFILLVCAINLISLNTSQAEINDQYLAILHEWLWEEITEDATPPQETPGP